MRSLKALLPFAVAVILALTALAAPASAAAPAPVPTWTQGQSVGYGTNLDLGALADTYLLPAIRSDNNITRINALNVTGSFDSWEVDTVTQVTSTNYTLGSQSAEGLKLHVLVNLTLNNLPHAGSYPGTWMYGGCFLSSAVPTGPGTLAVTFDATILSTTNGARRYQVSNLAYVNETQTATVQANVAFTGYHIPSQNVSHIDGQTSCSQIISYDNPAFTLTVDTKDQVRATYTPAWDFFNFPISDNKTWWANTTATIGGTLSGTINVQGLSSQDQKAFFDNLTKSLNSLKLTATGLSSFPIDLAKISIAAGTSYIVNNGVITDYPVPIKTKSRAIASVETLSDGNQHSVYLITNASYQCPAAGVGSLPIGYAAVYAPDFPAAGAGMVVGYQLLVCAGNLNLPGFELKNTSPGNAQQKIGQTENTYQTSPPAQGNAIAGFFMEAPYLGFILLAVVVLAVVALLVMRRRRRPSMAPPAAPPPAMPPPPSGGPGNP